MKSHYDICVIGGGPSGAIISYRLSGMGYNVCLIEKEPSPKTNLGTSLTPGVFHWLDMMNLSESINVSSYSHSYDGWLLWEDPFPTPVSNKDSVHVDRQKFDEYLLQRSQKSGTDLIRPAVILGKQRLANGHWKVQIKGSENTVIETRFIVEATGKKSIEKGTKSTYGTPTFATYSYWTNTQQAQNTFVEAGEDYWFWGAPCGSKYLICIFSDPDNIRKHQSNTSFYRNTVQKSAFAKPIVKGQPMAEVVTCSSTPIVDSAPVREDYLKIGDSAYTMDPISSQGVQKAIKSAYQGSIVINTILSEPDKSEQAIRFYKNSIEAGIQEHSRACHELYSKLSNFTAGQFWKKRMAASSGIKNELKNQTLPGQVFVNPECFQEVPFIKGDLISAQKGVRLNHSNSFRVFLENTPIVDLLERISGQNIEESLATIHRVAPNQNPVDILKWLFEEELLLNNIPKPLYF